MLSVVADVGGTNIRFAVCDVASEKLLTVKEYPCAEFMTLEQALLHYFSRLSEPVTHLCLAIACQVEGDLLSMTNFHWQFSKQALKKKLALTSLYVINDFTAISLAIPYIDSKDKIKIGRGEAVEGAVKAVFGAGTGLGVSHLIRQDNQWISLEGEGGHTGFAPSNREQADILLLLQEKFGHVSTERLLSGQGLVNIYHALSYFAGKPADCFEAAEITQLALEKKEPIALNTLTLFCQIMGSFAGNLALNLDCRGGVYIAGGITPRFVSFLKQSEFRCYFEAKGRLGHYLQMIPTYLITHDNPGLLGASVYLRQELS